MGNRQLRGLKSTIDDHDVILVSFLCVDESNECCCIHSLMFRYRNLGQVIASTMPKAPTAATTASSSKLTPRTYRALKTEQGVFTTPPYSANLKGLWKFKDADTASESAEALWERFETYRSVCLSVLAPLFSCHLGKC